MSKSKKKKKNNAAKAEERQELRRMRTEMQLKQNRRFLLILAGLIICIIIAVACVIAAANSRSTSYTAEQYAQLEKGMRYEEVIELLGNEGTSVLDGTDSEGASGVQTYIWTNDDGSHINITFVDDVVTGFSQSGLSE